MLKTVAGAALVGIGGTMYLLFRQSSLLIYQLACRAGMGELLGRWREHTLQWDMPEWVVYCLPDGLWSAGYVLIVSGLFRPHPLKWLVAGIIPLVGALSELAQWMGMLPGNVRQRRRGLLSVAIRSLSGIERAGRSERINKQ